MDSTWRGEVGITVVEIRLRASAPHLSNPKLPTNLREVAAEIRSAP